MTVAHALSKALPASVAEWMHPRFRMYQQIRKLYGTGGSIRRDPEISNWVAARPFGPDKAPLYVVMRSYKELRRFAQFGEQLDDVVQNWLYNLKGCDTYFDVGSANGLEGLLAYHLHKCKVVFVEPSTFSVESILKTIHIQASRGVTDRSKFEIVHAGCGGEETYGRAYYHETPKPGATKVSFSDLDGYDRGGRSNLPVFGTQWIKGVTLDSLVYKYGFPSPTHVKIDIDGFENRALRGARRLLEKRSVISWAIEANGEENITEVGETMKKAGYVEVAREQHNPGATPRTFDFIYDRA